MINNTKQPVFNFKFSAFVFFYPMKLISEVKLVIFYELSVVQFDTNISVTSNRHHRFTLSQVLPMISSSKDAMNWNLITYFGPKELLYRGSY